MRCRVSGQRGPASSLCRMFQALFAAIPLVLAVLALPPKPAFDADAFDFGRVTRGRAVDHEFVLINDGIEPLVVSKISMTTPLTVSKVPGEIAPGVSARIPVRLDTTRLRGYFEGRIFVFLAGCEEPEVLKFEGRVVDTVEVSPRAAFYLGARRGEARQASLEIINHEPEPLEIGGVDHAPGRFTTKIETLDPGRRYRITLTINPDGPGGRHRDVITVRTSSRNHPVLTIGANTNLRERVYAFPEEVDFGEVPARAVGALAQNVVVRSVGAADFQIRAVSDIPFLTLKSQRVPEIDGYQLTVGIDTTSVRAGPLRGKLLIRTNDEEFPLLEVPVSGLVLDR
jgi:hypothetical protein